MVQTYHMSNGIGCRNAKGLVDLPPVQTQNINIYRCLWWHISAITCKIIVLTSFYGVLTLFAAIYLSILYLTSRHNLLTKRHNFLTSRHNDLTSRHNYLTSDGRNKPPLMFIGGGLECCSVL